jgi:perosamine synthetase
MYEDIVSFIRSLFKSEEFIPLHEPRFLGNEKKYLIETIDSGFVSSVGKYVTQFEEMFAAAVGAKHAIAVANGTAALHAAMLVAKVGRDEEVITQPLTFVATCNAISYIGARPVFIDVDRDSLGLSAQKLKVWLEKNTEIKNGRCFNKSSKRLIRACVPMHTFGFPCEIENIRALCDSHHLTLIEDAAESLGSYVHGKHTGLFGHLGIFSFNGNKIITTGGGGVIVTDDSDLAKKAKHLTTTAKVPHRWEFVHDEIGFNYRMPNLNAALGCAQLEQLPRFIDAKRALAGRYQRFFAKTPVKFLSEPEGTKANYWLNTIQFDSRIDRDDFLTYSNDQKVMTRPVWTLMNHLPMFRQHEAGDLTNAEWLADRLVNIPSSALPSLSS